jgi:hypothetical protein
LAGAIICYEAGGGTVGKDGKKAVYTIDSTADTYPEVVKSGDDWDVSKLG